jgi:hypothetical protein
LPVKFSDFTSTERLGKRREPFKKVTQLPIHGEPINDLEEVRKKYGAPPAISNGIGACSEWIVESWSRAQWQGSERLCEKFHKTTCMSP